MIRKSKKNPEPGGPSVPAYIVTFSDMVTLLLTFFVMLLSLAQVQDPDLFNKSRDAFVEYIGTYGMGMMTGKQLVPDFGSKKVKHYIPEPADDTPARTIDSNEEDLRRLFNKVKDAMKVVPTRVSVEFSDYDITDIRFSSGQADLDAGAEKYLTQFAADFRHEANSQKTELYILGLAGDEPNEKQQWVLSSLRAQRVAEYLEQTGFRCPIFAWGAGAGGSYADRGSPISKNAQILIAILRSDDLD